MPFAAFVISLQSIRPNFSFGSSEAAPLPTPLTPADVVLSETETTEEVDETSADYMSVDDRRPLTKREIPKEAIYRPMNRLVGKRTVSVIADSFFSFSAILLLR